jgi:deoxyribonuclease-1
MKSAALLAFVLLSFSAFTSTSRKLPNGQLAYYGADFYKSKVSKDLLHKILNEYHLSSPTSGDVISNSCPNQKNCYRHGAVSYETARGILFGELFGKKERGHYYVVDVYCGKKIQYNQPSDISNMGQIVNIEHTWPQSKFSRTFDKNMQKSDLHHLYPTDSDANNRRANFEFGDIGEHQDELNVQNCSRSALADISGHFIFSPPREHKGNVARSLFYFATRYKLFIGPAEEMILKEWHKADPVDEAEKTRHEIIAEYQKVRNPFIDFPELVEKISDF